MTDVILEKQAVTQLRPESLKQEAPSFNGSCPRTAEGKQSEAQAGFSRFQASQTPPTPYPHLLAMGLPSTFAYYFAQMIGMRK
jgi:hypothetical protein